jgi:hypothetical protein
VLRAQGARVLYKLYNHRLIAYAICECKRGKREAGSCHVDPAIPVVLGRLVARMCVVVFCGVFSQHIIETSYLPCSVNHWSKSPILGRSFKSEPQICVSNRVVTGH